MATKSKTPRYAEVHISGLGGQGVLALGRTMSEAGKEAYRHVIFSPTYGGSMRGGESTTVIVLSDQPINSYGRLNPPACIAMGKIAFQQYEKRVVPGGVLIVESSVVPDKSSRADLEVFYVPSTQIAMELGAAQVANMVIMGVYLEATKAMPQELVERYLEEALKGRRGEHLMPLNRQALRRGAEIVREQRAQAGKKTREAAKAK